jgi:hypothetical protein
MHFIHIGIYFQANQPVKFAQNDLTGFQKRKAQAGEDKIQDDIMNLHEAYQFLMKKYKYGKVYVRLFPILFNEAYYSCYK